MNSSAGRADGAKPAPPRLIDLFLAFAGMSVVGFGGVMPFAYWMLVEKRRWMTPLEFSEALAVAQFLPGGNILNLAVAFGQRVHGPLGALAGVVGLIAGPFIVVIGVTALYLQYGQQPAVKGMLAGIAAAAAGLMLSMAAKMARPLLDRGALVPLAFAAVAFLAVAIAGISLPMILVVLVPLSVAHAWWKLP